MHNIYYFGNVVLTEFGKNFSLIKESLKIPPHVTQYELVWKIDATLNHEIALYTILVVWIPLKQKLVIEDFR